MPKGEETKVNVYDFGEKDAKTKRIKKAIPYGIYDILKKEGFVNVGIDANTAEFAVASTSALVGYQRKERVWGGNRDAAVCRLWQQ